MTEVAPSVTKPIGTHLVEFRIHSDVYATQLKDDLDLLAARPFLCSGLGRPDLDELEGEWFVRSVEWVRTESTGSAHVVIRAERLKLLTHH